SRSRLLLPVGGAGGVLGGRCVAVRGGPVGRPRAAVLVGTPGRRFLGPPSGALLLALVPPGPEGLRGTGQVTVVGPARDDRQRPREPSDVRAGQQRGQRLRRADG